MKHEDSNIAKDGRQKESEGINSFEMSNGMSYVHVLPNNSTQDKERQSKPASSAYAPISKDPIPFHSIEQPYSQLRASDWHLEAPLAGRGLIER